MMIDCRVMGHSGYVGDSSTVHHRLSMMAAGDNSALPVATLALFVCRLGSAVRPAHLPPKRPCTSVCVRMKHDSDADAHHYDSLLHGSAAEGCTNAAYPYSSIGSRKTAEIRGTFLKGASPRCRCDYDGRSDCLTK